MIKYKPNRVLEKRIKSVKNWIVQGSPGVAFLTSCAARSFHFEMNQVTKGHGIKLLISAEEKRGDVTHWLMDEDFYVSESKYFLARPKLIEKYFRYWQGKYEAFFVHIKKLNTELNLDSGFRRNNIDLESSYLRFYKAYIEEYAPALVSEYFTAYSDLYLRKLFVKYPQERELIQEAVKTPYRTFLQEERLDLLRLALKFSKNGLKNHSGNYFWLTNNYKHSPVLGPAYFKKELADLQKKTRKELKKEISALANYTVLRQNRIRNLRKESQITKKEFQKLLWLGKLAWMMDQRKKVNIMSSYYLNEFLRLAIKSEKLKLDFVDAQFLLHGEFVNLLLGRNVNLREVKQRKFGCVYAVAGGAEYIISGTHFLKRIKKEIIDKVLKKAGRSVKGYPAFPGVVKGRARIILNPHGAKFDHGEILVAFMTRPDFVPLMKRAAAIVTNEGGITSHAAIMSRELGIPCVVGTKRATQTFKNGDIIVVDANYGTVKKIN